MSDIQARVQARAMTVDERRRFQAAGVDMRHKSTEITRLNAAEDYTPIAIMNDEQEDWILTNVYPDLPGDTSNPDAVALATETFDLTFGLGAGARKNSSTSTSGTPESAPATA